MFFYGEYLNVFVETSCLLGLGKLFNLLKLETQTSSFNLASVIMTIFLSVNECRFLTSLTGFIFGSYFLIVYLFLETIWSLLFRQVLEVVAGCKGILDLDQLSSTLYHNTCR
jgi:hypothetical protein